MQNNHKHNDNAFLGGKNSYGVIGADNYKEANLPQGLSMAFCQNAAAMTAFENMNDSDKRKVLDRAAKVNSKKEMISLVQDIATNNL